MRLSIAFVVLVVVAGNGAIAAPAPAATGQPAFSVVEATVSELQKHMADGELTSHELVQDYLNRIELLDKAGPAINAMIELNPDALKIADELDGERRAGKLRGPLHGIPVVIKDNLDTADRMHTTAGSLALADSVAQRDSTVAAKLRAAGAVILGKTNLSEWANFRSTHSSSGWSGRGGQTRNPYALDRTPCGSSAGTGAAVSGSFATIGIGTETDGSIVCPSSMNGLVGIKPTVGLVSRAGIIPISHSQDTAGPMARTVTDAVLLLNSIAGSDPRDAATANADKHRTDYTQYLKPDGLKGARIGVVRKLAGFSPDVDALLDRNIAALRAAGATVVDPVVVPTLNKYGNSELVVLEYEFKHDLNAYLSGLPTGVNAPRSLQELIDFDKRENAREMPWFGQELFTASQARGSLSDKKYRDALVKDHRLAGTEGIDATLKKYKLDALIAPTAGPPWMIDWVNGDQGVGGSSSLAAVAGYPDITVPAGFVHGLPIGLSFFAGAWSEPTLIRLAYGFEQVTHARRAPHFRATINTP